MRRVIRTTWPNGNPKQESHKLYEQAWNVDGGPTDTHWYENGQKRKEIYLNEHIPGKILSVEWYDSGQIKEIWHQTEKHVSVNMVNSYYENGDPNIETIRVDGQIRRRRWNDARQLIEEEWMINGGYCRSGDQPAHISWYDNGQLQNEVYFNSRSEDYYKYFKWYENRQKKTEKIKDPETKHTIIHREWAVDGQMLIDKNNRHKKIWRLDGSPKYVKQKNGQYTHEIRYRKNGTIACQKYKFMRVLHNDAGPARIDIEKIGTKTKKYYLFGVKYEKEEYKAATKPPQVLNALYEILPAPICEEIWYYYRNMM